MEIQEVGIIELEGFEVVVALSLRDGSPESVMIFGRDPRRPEDNSLGSSVYNLESVDTLRFILESVAPMKKPTEIRGLLRVSVTLGLREINALLISINNAETLAEVVRLERAYAASPPEDPPR